MKNTLHGAFKSWTIWFNGLVATVLVALPMIQDALPLLAQYLDNAIYKQIGLVVVVINLLLRIKTTKALADK